MFLRFDPDWPPFDPPSPEPKPTPTPRHVPLDQQQQRRLMQAIGINILLLFVAPIGGATLLGALMAWWG